MDRYFFHIEDGRSLLDEEGIEFPSRTAAKVEAVRLMGELLKDRAVEFWDAQAMKVIVTDQRGSVLFVLDMSGIEAPALASSRRA